MKFSVILFFIFLFIPILGLLSFFLIEKIIPDQYVDSFITCNPKQWIENVFNHQLDISIGLILVGCRLFCRVKMRNGNLVRGI